MWLYIAGFFDGEGSVSKNRHGFRITIPQTNKEVLEKIKDFVTFGYIIKVTKRKDHWKESWVYYIAKQEEVYKFISGIKKFCIVKQSLIKSAIPELQQILKAYKKKKIKRLKIIDSAKKLRSAGLTYRQIGSKLKIDWGYARRVVIKN
ncbi:MAG: hypothetical protein G01um101413_950 [Parcubacteria group bacterium Gr01-1014_13]|nr:MAG: hypothetical protein G01um101413_950 [Parcubacteria group bacterium Gr01-1014_13]